MTTPSPAGTTDEGSTDASMPLAALKWHEKPSKWETITSMEELEKRINPDGNGGKLVALDLYAGWCSSCKSAFPALCKIPMDLELADKYTFLKVNIESKEYSDFVKTLSLSGIPFLAVFHPSDGRLLVGMTASFKRMAQVKANLGIIAANPNAKRFVLNPVGDVEAA